MAERARLLADAAAAFVDRAPIDWAALRARAKTPRDRAALDGLRLVADIRDIPGVATRDAEHAYRPVAALLIAFVASVETLAILGIVAAVALSGGGVAGRTSCLLALAFAAAAIPLARVHDRDARSPWLLAAFVASAAAFAQSAARVLPSPWPETIERALGGVDLQAFVPACLWQFALRFPRVRRFAPFDRFARLAAAAAWLVGCVLFSLNLAIRFDALERLATGRILALTVVGAPFAILVRARRAAPRERRKVIRLAAAIAVGGAPFELLTVARTLLPPVDAWFTSGTASASLMYWTVVASFAAAPALSAAAVLVDAPFGASSSSWSGTLTAFFRVRSRTIRRHDELARVLDRIASARGPREASAILADELQKALDARRVRIFPAAAVDRLRTPALHRLLQESIGPLDLSPDGPLLPLLPPADRGWIATHGIHLAAAMRRRDGTAAAVVAVGPKAGATGFSQRDRWLLVTLSAAATAWSDRRADSRADRDVAFECPTCGVVSDVSDSSLKMCRCSAPPALAALPRHLAGKFLVLRRLGAGGMGIVYLARDATLDRHVALKTLPRLHADAARQLREEARAMAALNHDALATLYSFEAWRGAPVLVGEFLPGGTLADRLETGVLSHAEAVALAFRLAQALDYMHRRGVLHQDVKPSNIGFAANGAAKLLDFGLIGGRGGTMAYLPPDANSRPPSAARDLWSLAVVMLEAISGANPFARFSRVPSSGWRHVNSDPSLQAFLERALSLEPSARFQTSRDFLDALAPLALKLR